VKLAFDAFISSSLFSDAILFTRPYQLILNRVLNSPFRFARIRSNLTSIGWVVKQLQIKTISMEYIIKYCNNLHGHSFDLKVVLQQPVRTSNKVRLTCAQCIWEKDNSYYLAKA